MADLLERLDSRELTEWGLFFAIKAEEAQAEAGGEPGEMVDPVALCEDDEDDEDE